MKRKQFGNYKEKEISNIEEKRDKREYEMGISSEREWEMRI